MLNKQIYKGWEGSTLHTYLYFHPTLIAIKVSDLVHLLCISFSLLLLVVSFQLLVFTHVPAW